jgi:TatD DNase family protein
MALQLVDTHCHLDPEYFPSGPDAALSRAEGDNVVGFVVIGVGKDLAPARGALELAARLPERVAAVVGVHPHDATTLTDALYDELAVMAADPRVVAIGEIGLDYHYDHSPRHVQSATFERLIALARHVNKPIVVHTRSAAEDTLRALEFHGARDVGGVIHCFSEDKAFASRALDLGFDLSFSGIVTFKSAFVVHTARRVAELRGMAIEELATATTANARRRFGRDFGGLRQGS